MKLFCFKQKKTVVTAPLKLEILFFVMINMSLSATCINVSKNRMNCKLGFIDTFAFFVQVFNNMYQGYRLPHMDGQKAAMVAFSMILA